jgi:hypothetical protein
MRTVVERWHPSCQRDQEVAAATTREQVRLDHEAALAALRQSLS